MRGRRASLSSAESMDGIAFPAAVGQAVMQANRLRSFRRAGDLRSAAPHPDYGASQASSSDSRRRAVALGKKESV